MFSFKMPYYRRNLIVLSATIFLATASWGQIVPFLPLFLKDIGVGQGLMAWTGIIFAAHPVAAIIAQPFWGKMGDSRGRKPMAIRAGICLSGIYLLMSVCNAPWQVAVTRFLNGALTGFIPSSMALIATNTPEDRAPGAMATAQTSSAVGTIVGPAIGGLLAATFGYRGSMRISGLIVLFATLLVLILVEEKIKVSAKQAATSLWDDFRFAMTSPVILAIMATVMLSGTFGAAINPFLALHMESLRGGNIWLTGVIFSLPGVAFVASAHLWSRFGDRYGFSKAIRIGLLGAALLTFLMVFARQAVTFSAIYFFAGIFLAAVSPSTAAMICILVDNSFRGRAYGMQQSAGMIGALIAPLAAGYIGKLFGMTAVFVMVGIVFLSGFFLLSPIYRQAQTSLSSPESDFREDIETPYNG